MAAVDETVESRAQAAAKGIAVSLVVRKDKAGVPYWDAAWRDSSRSRRLRRIGPAWLDPGNPFLESGASRERRRAASWERRWTPRRGKPKDPALDERTAHARAADLVLDRERELLQVAEVEQAEQRGPVLFSEVAALWLDVRAGDVQDGLLKPSSLSDYRSMLRDPGAEPKTRGRKVKGGETGAWILTELGDLPVAEITAETVDAFERKLQAAKRSPRTRTKYKTVISMVLDHARHLGHLERNVVADAPRKRKARRQDTGIKTYDIATVERIAARIPDTQLADVVRVLALTGMRLGEALALRWSDVSFERQSVTIRRTYVAGVGENSPKSGKLRTVPLNDQAAVVLDRVSRRDDWTRPGDLVFGDTGGNPRKDRPHFWRHVDPATVRRAYLKARDAVIADDVRKGNDPPEPLRIHDLRHAYGSTVAAAGVPIPTLQQWMGHANIGTTMVYVHFQPQADDAARLTAAFGGLAAEITPMTQEATTPE